MLAQKLKKMYFLASLANIIEEENINIIGVN